MINCSSQVKNMFKLISEMYKRYSIDTNNVLVIPLIYIKLILCKNGYISVFILHI